MKRHPHPSSPPACYRAALLIIVTASATVGCRTDRPDQQGAAGPTTPELHESLRSTFGSYAECVAVSEASCSRGCGQSADPQIGAMVLPICQECCREVAACACSTGDADRCDCPRVKASQGIR